MKNKLTKKIKDRIFICCMLIIPVGHFLLFWCRINLGAIALAFEDSLTGEWGFANFERFFRNFALDWNSGSGLRIALENTFISVGIRMLISTPLIVFVSYLLFKRFWGHMIFRIGFYIPAIVGVVITVTMRTYILDATGPIVKLGTALGIKWPYEVLQRGLIGNMLTARPTYFIQGVLCGIAGGTILLLTGIYQRIPRDLFDSMKMDGVGMFREFIHLIVPCSWSTIGIQWIMTFAAVWGDSSGVMMLTGGNYNTNNIAYYLFKSQLSAVSGTGSFNYPAAMGILLTLIVAPLTLLLRKLANKIVEPVEF